MPTLDFKGKQFVYSHHLSVPFRELKVVADKSLPQQGKAASLDDNLIIHGDNLEALKALLPTHAGKVDCIFIDPPYNTGNEGWCYNDNVRSPLMQEWLKKSANPVDKEDMERHDKWLCMMWPRLTLLRELLADEGSIWMTLDDNEIHRARMLFDEIFGEENFVACCAWEKTYTPKSNGRVISTDHDYVLIYSKTSSFTEHGWNYLAKNEEQVGRYTNSDNDPNGPWRTYPLDVRTEDSERREKYRYEVVLPSGRVVKPAKGRHWALPEAEFIKQRDAGEIYFGKKGDAMPTKKAYYDPNEDKGVIARSWWTYKDVKGNQDAKKTLLDIFGDVETDFLTPKPYQLIQRILDIATDKNSIILDSFAGSGTTAHAVLEANKNDSGNRKFILIECEEYCDRTTASRVRGVIKGYKFKGTQKQELLSEKITWSVFEKKQAKLLDKIAEIEAKHAKDFNKIKKELKDGVLTVTGERKVDEFAPGIGGSFTYCTLGEPIKIESLLTGEAMPSFDALARYVFYTATGQSLETVAKASADGFIGETDLFRIHLFYRPDSEWLRSNEAALNADKVAAIVKNNATKKRTIVFAVAKFMSQKDLTEKHIEFCQLPYAIHRIMGA